jgi:predicted metalloendopeptidase
VSGRLARGALALLLLAGCAPLAVEGEQPLAPLRALDPADLDRGADPCTDIWRFANGGWLDRNAVPADEDSFGVSDEVEARNAVTLRALLQDAAARTDAPRGSREQLLGDFWCSCMDTAGIEQQGLLPISDLLGRIHAIADKGDLLFVLVFAQLQGLPLVVRVDVDQAADDPTQLLPWVWPDGLGLPDVEAYSLEDADSQQLREEYVAHLAALDVLAGGAPEQAAADAAAAMELETALAARSRSAVEERDPSAVWNPFTLPEADALTPGLPWSEYLGQIGAARPQRVCLAEPDFCVGLARLVVEEPIATWQAYLRCRALDLLAPRLGAAFVAEDFSFHGRLLAGATEAPPRWKQCLHAADDALGLVLGRAFVERTLPPATVERARLMAEDLRAAMRARLEAATWMTASTRRAALEKLAALTVQVGAPARWPDTVALQIARTGYATNLQAAASWEVDRQFQRLRRPADRDEWPEPPQTVDAFYLPSRNEVIVPAGLLQPPFFAAEQDDAANLGGLGAVLGHEITHAFDDEGSQYDAVGALDDWWTEQDADEFERRGDALVDQFDAQLGVDELHVDGELTFGENLADLGGLRLAFDAFRAAQAGRAQSPDAQGFTPEQRFFLAYAQSWREQVRPEMQRWLLRNDEHAPPRLRAVIPLQDLPEFRAAFGCAPGAPPVEIW